MARHRCLLNPSAAERVDERLGVDASLAKNSTQGAPLDLTMERHHATNRSTAEHHMTATLPHDSEPEALQRTDGLCARNVREFRQRRRCGTS